MSTSSSLLRAVHHLRDRVGDPVSDGELLRRYAQDRDEDAFAVLVRRYGGLVFGVARRQLGDVHHVEDVFQATFLALARSSAQGGELRSLTNWLYTVAMRQARKAKHREKRRAEFDRSRTAPKSGTTDPLDILSGRELVNLIDEELERLPENYRLVLLLCCIQGLTREEAADRLGWTMGTVKGRLERGRRRLADQLAKKGVAPSALVFEPFSDIVPEPLTSRAVALAGSPWAKSIPTSVIELLALPSASKLLPLVALCCTLFALGLTLFLLQPGPGTSAPGSPSVAARVKDDARGDALPERALRRFGSARYRHGEPILGLTVSRDDRLAVAFGRSLGSRHRLPRACIYDLRNGRRLAKLGGVVDSVQAVAFSSDGKTLFAKRNGGLHLHDPKTGAEVEKISVWLGNPRSTTYWLSISPDGSKAAFSAGMKEIHILDLETKKVAHTVKHKQTVYAGVFSPDSKTLAAGDYGFVRLWDVATGKEVRQFPKANARSDSLAFSPDGKTLAGAGGAVAGEVGDGLVRLWDVATGKVLHMFEKNGGRIRSVAFSHNGKSIAAAGDTIRLYDLATKKERLSIPQRALGLHFSPGDDVLTAAVDGAIHRWETKTGKLLTPPNCDSGVDRIGSANQGRTLVTLDQSGIIHLWDRATGKHLHQVRMDTGRELGISPDGRHLVLSKEGDGQELKLFDIEGRRLVDRFAKGEGYAHDKEFTQDGKTLVTLDHSKGIVRLWDIATGKETRSFAVFRENEVQRSYLITSCVLSPDDKTLAVAYRPFSWVRPWTPATALRLWDVTTGKELVQFDGHTRTIGGMAFSTDGRFLASFADSPHGPRLKQDAFFIWDVKAKKQLVRLADEKTNSAYRVAFSTDGRTMASASLDGTVRVWEVGSWTLRTKFQAHGDHVTALHFAPDGTLFTGSFDSTVLEWNLRPGNTAEDMPLSTAWAKLLDPRAQTAFTAQGRLLATPRETVALLGQKLRPVSKVDPKRVEKLLADLDSEDFDTRETASRALEVFGHSIEPTLRTTLAKTSSKEVRSRVQALLSRLEPTATPPTVLRTLRAIEVLEWLATPAAHDLLNKLAKGEPNALLTRAAASALGRKPSLRSEGKR